jgi:hypothetical protein
MFLIFCWFGDFIKSLESSGGNSPTNQHLLILDGYNFHFTLDVVYKAKDNGLDIITLPLYKSHRL